MHLDGASYHDFPKLAGWLNAIGCTLVRIPPYRSELNAIEYVHHMQKCYMRRDVGFSRACPLAALIFSADLVEQPKCENLVLHVLGRK